MDALKESQHATKGATQRHRAAQESLPRTGVAGVDTAALTRADKHENLSRTGAAAVPAPAQKQARENQPQAGAATADAPKAVAGAASADTAATRHPHPPQEPLLPRAQAGRALSTDERLAWWRQARFGMFIHWGPYSILGGEWQGKRVDGGVGHGVGEWIMYNAQIPVGEYAKVARTFNPQHFNADDWAHLAKSTGQKYLILTTKHHDGFALFKSAASSYNCVDEAPFGRDIVAELATACARHGIRFGLYYSQAQDWHHAGGAAFNGLHDPNAVWAGGDAAAGHWDAAQHGDFEQYLQNVSLPQVRELLTNYGPVDIFWWDTPIGMDPRRAQLFQDLLELQPGVLTNNRLLNPERPNAYSGDTETPEQFIPATGLKDRAFEVCMTVNDTWGYKTHDQNWKPARQLIRQLVDTVSKGGNFLLNIGPDGEGRIPAPCRERLHAVGRWMRTNGESINGGLASPFAKLPWGRCTRRRDDKGELLYLHVFRWPQDGLLQVPGLRSPILEATLLADGTRLDVLTAPNSAACNQTSANHTAADNTSASTAAAPTAATAPRTYADGSNGDGSNGDNAPFDSNAHAAGSNRDSAHDYDSNRGNAYADGDTRAYTDSATIRVPFAAPDADVSVVRLRIQTPLEVAATLPCENAQGLLRLPAWQADIHNQPYCAQALLDLDAEHVCISGWTDHRTWLGWEFEVRNAGTFEVFAESQLLPAQNRLHLSLRPLDAEGCETDAEQTGAEPDDAPKVVGMSLDRGTSEQAGASESAQDAASDNASRAEQNIASDRLPAAQDAIIESAAQDSPTKGDQPLQTNGNRKLHQLGELTVERAGRYHLSLRAADGCEWKPAELSALKLRPRT